jgi:hypothetical protein
MKAITTAAALLFATILMTACGNKESAAPAEEAPAATAAPAEAAPAETAPAETAPAATSEAPANDEDAGHTSGDKVAPKTN